MSQQHDNATRAAVSAGVANKSAAVISERLMAIAIRVLAMVAVKAANSGHPGMPM
jgi:hypothetical protein